MKKLSLILFVILLYSCGRTYKLSKEAKAWIPYHQGDQIIFEGNDSILDTMSIVGIVNVIRVKENPKNDWNDYEYIAVNALVPDRWTSFNHKKYRKSHQQILWMDIFPNYTSVEISFNPFQHYFKSMNQSFIEILRQSNSNLITKYRTYNDIYMAGCDEKTFCNESNGIDSLLWSTQFGIVKFDTGDTTWVLKELKHQNNP